MSVMTSSAMAVLEAQEFVAHLLEAAGLFPQLGGLHHGHDQLDGASLAEFFTDDVLDLADGAQAHGHVVVQARAQLLDQAGAHHQLVADDLGICRGFFEGGDEELGGFHGANDQAWPVRTLIIAAGQDMGCDKQ